jgi:hypothetical protein
VRAASGWQWHVAGGSDVVALAKAADDLVATGEATVTEQHIGR